MSEPPEIRHGLEAFIARATTAGDGGVRARVVDDAGFINLRGSVDDKRFLTVVETAVGQPLPVAANTMSTGEHRIFWLGPDEWLILTGASKVAALSAGLTQSLSVLHASVNDQSGGQVAMQLSGNRVRELLAGGCTLDLHPREFGVGECAQTGLAKANVLLACVDDTPTYLLIVRRSFADYLGRWIAEAGTEFGIGFDRA